MRTWPWFELSNTLSDFDVMLHNNQYYLMLNGISRLTNAKYCFSLKRRDVRHRDAQRRFVNLVFKCTP